MKIFSVQASKPGIAVHIMQEAEFSAGPLINPQRPEPDWQALRFPRILLQSFMKTPVKDIHQNLNTSAKKRHPCGTQRGGVILCRSNFRRHPGHYELRSPPGCGRCHA